MSDSPIVRCQIDGPIGWLTFDNPGRRNALPMAAWASLPARIATLEADPAVRLIILRGAGDTDFGSGADISEFPVIHATVEAARHFDGLAAAAYDAVALAEKPTLAMIRGLCLGGGFGLAACCDMRLGGFSSSFMMPAARLGLAYPPGAVRYFVDALGPSVAKDLFFTARRFGAEEARALGFLNRLVPDEDLEPTTLALAAEIAANAPLTLKSAKLAIDHAAGRPQAADPERMRAYAAACYASADYQEGRAAFLAKRKPVFEGR
jgi:enoyl-CoA hydratase/carnithine racemase